MDEREWNPDKDRRGLPLNEEIGFHRRAASRVGNVGFALAVSGVRKTGANVLFCEIRKFPQNIGMAHAASKIFENVINRNSQTANARLAPAFSGLELRTNGAVRNIGWFLER